MLRSCPQVKTFCLINIAPGLQHARKRIRVGYFRKVNNICT